MSYLAGVFQALPFGMRVKPFYSYLRGIALENLWHDNDACQVGQSIARADRRPGTDDIRKHCPFCAILNQPGATPARPVRT